MRNKKVDIILSNRIGDSLFSIPAIVCLKQLLGKSNPNNYKVRILSTNMMTGLYNTLDLFEFVDLNLKTKVLSHIFPADISIFLQTTSKNYGICGKITYGENTIKNRFNHNIDYLYVLDDWHKGKLAQYLKEEFNFYPAIIKYFGLLNTLGYTDDEIIETFEFDLDILHLKDKYSDLSLDFGNYAVFCKEAGYNPKLAKGRLWGDAKFYETAKYLYEKHGLKSVFVGIKQDLLPQEEYIIDKRRVLNTFELADLFKTAKCFVGNDSGLLHFSNLMKCKGVGIHWSNSGINCFVPMHSSLLKRFLMPEVDEVTAVLDEIIS